MNQDLAGYGSYPDPDDEPSQPPTDLEREQQRQLEECWELLLDMAECVRPIGCGYKDRALELLRAHRVLPPAPATQTPEEKVAGRLSTERDNL